MTVNISSPTYRAQRARMEELRREAADVRKQITEGYKHRKAAERTGDHDLLASVARKGEELQQRLDLIQSHQSEILRQWSGASSSSLDYTLPFFENPQATAALEQIATSSQPIGRMPLGKLYSADAYAEMLRTGNWGFDLGAQGNVFAAGGDITMSPTDPARYGPYFGVVSQLRRRLSILDLIPTVTADVGASFFYSQETGSFDTALETAELSLKPEADEQATAAQVVFATIAHYIKIARQALQDIPVYGQTLASRLTYGVNLRLENQILGGDGSGANILGILNTTGIGDVAFASGTPLADLVQQGIVTLQQSYAQPQAVVINPATWASIQAVKTTYNSYANLAQGPIGLPTTDTLWGLPVIATTAMPVNQALVADFNQGCQLFVRQGVTLMTSDQDQDDFVRNRCTLLAEGRFGVAVWRPAAFCIVNLA